MLLGSTWKERGRMESDEKVLLSSAQLPSLLACIARLLQNNAVVFASLDGKQPPPISVEISDCRPVMHSRRGSPGEELMVKEAVDMLETAATSYVAISSDLAPINQNLWSFLCQPSNPRAVCSAYKLPVQPALSSRGVFMGALDPA